MRRSLYLLADGFWAALQRSIFHDRKSRRVKEQLAELLPARSAGPDVSSLTISNPRLASLYATYESSTPFLEIASPYWHGVSRDLDLRNFRAHGSYLWTTESRLRYKMTVRYIKKFDSLGLLRVFGEDGAFGCKTVDLDGITVSRDKLDSIMEVYYLMEVLGIGIFDRLRVLDIGAGYGRLAHRFTTLFQNAEFYCVDTMPVSTFLCEFYLRFRNVKNAYVAPLHELDLLLRHKFDFAINVHSFPEQPEKSIEFWMSFLDRLDVKRLVVVDHNGKWLTMEPPDNRTGSYFRILQQHNWTLVDARSKYSTILGQLFGLYPEAVYSLFVRN